MSPSRQAHHVPGLTAPGSIGIDRHGIPHIRAENEHDLFLLQGYNAARERLFQIDLWRKRGLGRLAADFGPGFLEQDRASRLFLYRGDMDADFAAYAPDARAICTAFVAGINAYIAETEADPSRLPPEFALLGTRPERWAPEDCIRIRTHSLTRNVLSEVLRSNVLARADHRTDLLRRHLAPPVTPSPVAGLDPSEIPLEVLDLFKLAGASVTFTRARMAASLAEAPQWRGVTDLNEVVRASAESGSNNWAVSGTLTDTGMPILASDPHRLHTVPSIRMVVHLTCPTLDVIGAVEPHSPGITFGHNGTVGWAVTIFYIDQEDLYVARRTGPRHDRSAIGDEALKTVVERVAVKGAPDQDLKLTFTRHGPVIHADATRIYSVRSVWFEPGTAPYLRHLSLMRARNLADFRRGTEGWGAPSVNFAYADTGGTIAWMPAGMNPKRQGWDGLTPVPADAGLEWDGFQDPSAMPLVVNPPEGFIATANEMNLPPDWNHEAHPIGFEWIDRARADRLREVLSTTRPHTLATSMALQTDIVSIPARRLAALIEEMGEVPAALRARVEACRDLVAGWDGALGPESAAGALIEVWWTRHLRQAVFEALVPQDALRFMGPGDTEGLLMALETPDDRFGNDPVAARDALIARTLAAAHVTCTGLMGEDATAWAWGRLHHGLFPHPLADLLPSDTADAWSTGPFAIGGSGSTPMHTGYRPQDFRVVMGSSFRLVVDFSNFDQSKVINTPGQSGNPLSPHYRDLAPLWAHGRYVPLPYSPAAVESSVVHWIDLAPT